MVIYKVIDVATHHLCADVDNRGYIVPRPAARTRHADAQGVRSRYTSLFAARDHGSNPMHDPAPYQA